MRNTWGGRFSLTPISISLCELLSDYFRQQWVLSLRYMMAKKSWDPQYCWAILFYRNCYLPTSWFLLILCWGSGIVNWHKYVCPRLSLPCLPYGQVLECRNNLSLWISEINIQVWGWTLACSPYDVKLAHSTTTSTLLQEKHYMPFPALANR